MSEHWTRRIRPLLAEWKAAEWVVFLFLAPLGGFLTMTHPHSLAEFWGTLRTCSLEAGIQTVSCGMLLGGILGGGFICGFLAPRGKGLTNLTFMAVVVICIGFDCARNPDGHNLIGVELLMYGAETVMSMGTGFLGSLLRTQVGRVSAR